MSRLTARGSRPARVSLIVTAVWSILTAACASLHNTPEQDLAWSRWTTCRAKVPGTEINTIQLDGRISFWYNALSDGRAMSDCLAQVAKDGPALPEPKSEPRPGGGSGGGGGM